MWSIFSTAQLQNAYLVQMWEIDPPKPSIFIHIYPHRFPALELYGFEVLGFFPFEKFGCWFEVGAGRSRRWWDGCSSEKLQLSWLKSSCSSLVWMGPLEVVAVPPFFKKENGETPIFSHDDKFPTKIMVLFLETKLYKNGGQGLPGFTISDRPKNCWMSYHVLTGSLYYQPKQCTIMKGIPKITIHLPCLILPNLMCQKKACPQALFC